MIPVVDPAAAATEAAAELAAGEQTSREVAKLGIPDKYVDQFPKREFRKWKDSTTRHRVRELARTAREFYPLHRSDYDTFQQIAIVDFFLDRVMNKAVEMNAWDSLTSINDKGTLGKGEGAMVLAEMQRLMDRREALLRSALLTRASRQNLQVTQERKDAFAFFADARRALLAKNRPPPPALEVKVVSEGDESSEDNNS